jgi:hypothetical protein
MGVKIFRYTLHRCGEHWFLTRTVRPQAPNPAGNSVEFADNLATVKARILVRSWLKQHNQLDEHSSIEDLGNWPGYYVNSSYFGALHGHSTRLWIAQGQYSWGHPICMVGPGEDEQAFWRWATEAVRKKYLECLTPPATQHLVHYITEADYRLIDEFVFTLHDVEWGIPADSRNLQANGGLAALADNTYPPCPTLTETEYNSALLSALRRAGEEYVVRRRWHSLAFLSNSAVAYSPEYAWEWFSLVLDQRREDSTFKSWKSSRRALAGTLLRLRQVDQEHEQRVECLHDSADQWMQEVLAVLDDRLKGLKRRK